MIGPVYHAGELEVQARAGAAEQAQHVGAIVRSNIPRIAQDFLECQRMAILSTLDSSGTVWASVLTGQTGFMRALDSQTVQVNAVPVTGDPLAKNLNYRREAGLFVIELSTRRRMKVKGRSERNGNGALIIHADRVYSQCTKYIQMRTLIADSDGFGTPGETTRTQALTLDQQKWVANADTFFIASFHPETGADASHRGGNPGFIKVVDPKTLLFPNYWGNTMFNTLGNLTVNPHAGLLFIDFATGSTLQLTGEGFVIWDKDRLAECAGAIQLVEYRISQVIATPHAIPLRWRFVGYSASNPG